MNTFIPFPRPDSLASADLRLTLGAYALMKLGGQVAFSFYDLKSLARDYAGFTVAFEPESESFVFKLTTRPEEYPLPENSACQSPKG